MAHEIRSLDNPSYVKVAAWHGLGHVVESLDKETVLQESAMDYPVAVIDLWERDDSGNFHPLPSGFKATIRGDRNPGDPLRYFATVGDRYRAMQNQRLLDICKAIAANSDLVFETAGTLKNGALAWLLAKRPDTLSIWGDDTIQQYLLVSTAHDGSNATVVQQTTTRVVCNNTLQAALNGDCKYRYAIRHTEGAEWSMNDITYALTHANDYSRKLMTTLNSFAKTAVDARFVEGFLSAIIPGDETHTTKQGVKLTQCGRKRNELRDLINGGQIGGRMESVMRNGQPTAFGVYSAMTQWLETMRSTRQTVLADGSIKPEAEARMESVLFGSGSDLRDAAMGLLTRTLGVDTDGNVGHGLADAASGMVLAGAGIN